MTPIQSRIDQELTAHFQEIPAQYQSQFDAVQAAYNKEYPSFERLAAVMHGQQALWELQTGCVVTNLSSLTMQAAEPAIENLCRVIAVAIERSCLFSSKIQQQIANFENKTYCNICPELDRTKYINIMKAFKQRIDAVHKALKNLWPTFLYQGNNLLHALKTGGELSSSHRNWPFLTFKDVYGLAKIDSQTEDSWSFVEEAECTVSLTPPGEPRLLENYSSSEPNTPPESPQPSTSKADSPSESQSTTPSPKPSWAAVVGNRGRPTKPPLVSHTPSSLTPKRPE